MLSITNPAKARLAQMLATKSDDAVVRIVRRKRRLRLSWSIVRADDRTFARDGRVILALDGYLSERLSRRQLDVRQTSSGPRLRLKSN